MGYTLAPAVAEWLVAYPGTTKGNGE